MPPLLSPLHHHHLLLLLLLLLPSFAHAQTPAPAAFAAHPTVLLLRDGFVTHELTLTFNVSAALPADIDFITALSITATFRTAPPSATATLDTPIYVPAEPPYNRSQLLVPVRVAFQTLPGPAVLRVALTDPSAPVAPSVLTARFHVLGVALFSGPPHSPSEVYTGRSSELLVLPSAPQVHTVHAAVYASKGAPTIPARNLDNNSIAFSVTPPSPALAWDSAKCLPTNATSSLNDRCAMAFGDAFSNFSIRLSTRLRERVRVDVRWNDIGRFAAEFDGDDTGVWQSDAEELLDDHVTFFFVQQQGQGPGPGPTPVWKVAVIAVVIVLLINAAVVLVCCWACGRTRDGKRRSWGRAWYLARARVEACVGAGGEAEERAPSSPRRPDSIVGGEELPLGMGSVAAGLVPPETTPSKELSAARLVLPREIARGVELDPSSLDGSGQFPEAGDGASLGRGMTSFPLDMYRNGLLCLRGSMGGGKTDEEDDDDEFFEEESGKWYAQGEGEGKRGADGGCGARGGVGAAIDRVRQVDLLKGPHSKGNVGRNGEPLQAADVPAPSANVLTLSNAS